VGVIFEWGEPNNGTKILTLIKREKWKTFSSAGGNPAERSRKCRVWKSKQNVEGWGVTRGDLGKKKT